jgi:hypothetical protein
MQKPKTLVVTRWTISFPSSHGSPGRGEGMEKRATRRTSEKRRAGGEKSKRI